MLAVFTSSWEWKMNRSLHERKSPGCNRGSEVISGGEPLLQSTYTALREKETAATALAVDELEFLSRWGLHVEDGRPRGYAATLLPGNGNWACIEYFPTWWEAMARAIDMAAANPRCVYVGGSAEGGQL
jgi:hypothetical protein|tara:strand:+ start:444 stop:830 length:387 start_codon:yes stop_codon:yes gene_type:complete